MRFRLCLIVLTFNTLWVGSSSAQDSPLLGPSGFAFNGKWVCTGSIPTPGKTLAHHALYEGRMVSGGKWIELVQKDIDPEPYDATMLIGYDSNQKRVVNYIADNHGWAVLTGPGWKGQSLTLTMTGEASIPGYSVENPLPISRVTYEVQSADAFSLHWEVFEGSQWKPDDSLACARPDPNKA